MVEKRLEADWALGKKGIKRKNANTHEIQEKSGQQ